MKSKTLLLLAALFLICSVEVFASSTVEPQLLLDDSEWVCEGYCFLGGDVPTNPFQPVSSTGATEEEARDNIDCGPYQETGISCRKVKKDQFFEE